MPTASKTKRPAPRQRALLEQFAVGTAVGTPALEIDREQGIIFGVKVLGRYSRNNHGLVEAENGSEYSPACMRSAIAMYEGAKVKLNHPRDRTKPGAERDVDDNYGVLRNVRIESEADGVRADLHYLKTHRKTPEILEDVERQLGLWGLSHNAAAARERFDRGAKRLVIEELATVRSVDLVDKPATNRNLWESEYRPVSTCLRDLLESRRPKWSKPRRKWADRLLEDDAMAPTMDAPVEAPADGGDEDDALWSGFKGAIDKLFEKYAAGEMDEKEVGKQVVEYLKAHKKLTAADEPEAPKADASESDDDDDGSKDKVESEELVTLRREKAARDLCESLGYTPTALQIEAVAGIKDGKRQRELAESYKPAGKTGGGFKSPKSAAPGSVGGTDKKKPAQRETTESEVVPAADGMRTLLGD